MAKLLTILLIVVSVSGFAQNYPITGLLISFPPHTSNGLAGWANSKFSISASTSTANGKIDGAVQESRILVIIKKNGAKVCGGYTSTTAPISKFNTGNKTWSGGDAFALLGQDCTLPPGDYELSVQFWGNSSGVPIAFSQEKVQAFSIPTDTQTAIPISDLPDTKIESEANAGNRSGISININGLGGILFGGSKKTTPACGAITAVTRVICAGRNRQTGLASYNITMILTNKPIEQVKSCAFVVNTITTQDKGTLKFSEQALPVAIASSATVSYTFLYTPPSAKATDAQLNISGTWEGNAISLELKPALKLPVCLDCDCGSWDNAGITVAFNGAVKTNLKDGETTSLSKGAFSFAVPQFSCSSGDGTCTASYSWSVKGGPIEVSGTRQTFIYNFSQPGLYTIAITPLCNGKKCTPYNVNVKIEDTPPIVGVKTVDPPPIVTVPPPSVNVAVVIPDIKKPQVDPVQKPDSNALSEAKYYYDLDTDPTYTVTELFDHVLNVQFYNNYAAIDNIKLNIYDVAAKKMLVAKIAKDVKLISTTGLNRLSVDINNYDIGAGKTYTFTLLVFSSNYHLVFKLNNGHGK
jgi:hypothetical protein